MKNLKILGKALSKAEQKTINGGKTKPVLCVNDLDCGDGFCCWLNECYLETSATCQIDGPRV